MLNGKPLFTSWELQHLPRWMALACEAALAVIVGDFFYYWYHRFQHRHLWRFHAVHHSLREMNGLNNYHHFTEPLMRTLLCGVPTGLLIGDPYAVPVIGSLIAFQGYYLHSTTRLNLGRLGNWIVDNRFHRIHHSMEPAHFDKNFSIFTSLWDRVFGTAWLTREGDWPETGIADFPEPANVVEYLCGPFVWKPSPAAPVPAKAGVQDRSEPQGSGNSPGPMTASSGTAAA